MPSESSQSERRQLDAVALGIVVAAVVICAMSGNLQLPDFFLFIPTAVVLLAASSIVVAPEAARAAVAETMTKQSTAYGIAAAVVFVVLIPVSETLLLWPIACKFVHFDCFPIGLGFAGVAVLAGTLRLHADEQPICDTFPGRDVLASVCVLSFAILYVGATDFSFVSWWILIPSALALLHCACAVFKLGITLGAFAATREI